MPVAFKLDHLQPSEPILSQKISNFFHFHTGRPILIAPEGQYGEKAILPTPEKNESEGFQGLEPPISSQCSRSRANSRLLLLLSGVMVGHLI